MGDIHSTKKLDLTGQRFGRLTALEPASGTGVHTAWRCRCDCGNEAVVRTGSLRSGNTRSCGCLSKDYRRNLCPDLTGQVFGRLTVLGPAGSVNWRTAWRCRCECGNETVVKTDNLRSGNVKSCGCLRDDHIRKARLDLTGQTFGRLTALEPAENLGGYTAWRCRCECGNETVVRTRSLRSGNTRSCGCLLDEHIRKSRHDLTGRTFGRLTVLERAESVNGHTAWRCRCECGTETVVRTGSLLAGSAKSCGCQEHARRNDLTGQTFGKLIVLEPVKNKYGQAAWRCRCECGNETVVRTWDLTSGHVASCGCLKDAVFEKSEGDLTGQVFGRLTVLEPAGTVDGNAMWRCHCECGKETVVRGSGLRTGNTRSCGCLRGRWPRKRKEPREGTGE